MLASITPLGERGRQNRWWLTTVSYELGSLAGGASIGALAGTAGWLILRTATPSPAVRLAVAAAVCAAAVVADLVTGDRHLTGWHRQVNKDWLDRYRGWVYGAGFGYQLGLGIVTIVNSAATYCMVALALLLASPGLGAIAGATYGVVRAAPLLGFKDATDFTALHRAHGRLQGVARLSRYGSIAVVALAAVGLATAAAIIGPSLPGSLPGVGG